MTTTQIAEHTIPQTDATITITQAPASGPLPAYYGVTRTAGPGFNYLSAGRATEAEARELANELWADAVSRRNAARAERVITEELGKPEITEGFWVDQAGSVYKVQRAVHGSGKLYGKVLGEDGQFTYQAGVPMYLRWNGGQRLTLERAKELGKLYGRCVVCGATLTAEESIEAGIGPVCAGKF